MHQHVWVSFFYLFFGFFLFLVVSISFGLEFGQNLLCLTEEGSGPVGPLQRQLGLGVLGALLALLVLLLGLPELGQVEGGDLLGLLDLLLVSLDLGLQLLGQLGHPLLVLAILLSLELQLLHPALGALVGLEVLLGSALGVAQLHLQLPDPSLELAHGGPAELGGVGFGIGQPGLELGQLTLVSPLGPALAGGVVLLGPELVRKPGTMGTV